MFRGLRIAPRFEQLKVGQAAAESDEADAEGSAEQERPALEQALALVGVVEEDGPVHGVSFAYRRFGSVR